MSKKEVLEKLKLFKEQNSSKYNIDAIGILAHLLEAKRWKIATSTFV